MNPSQRARRLDLLAARIRRCRRCRLCHGRRHAVPGEGNPAARILLLGEAPGAAEDETGRPFVGRSGRFLTRLLTRCGLQRNDLFVTSSVKCRPPGNRPPRADELAICKAAWLDRQIELIDPRVIVVLGGTPLKQMLGIKKGLEHLHGTVREVNGRVCLITYHPAAAMRFPRIRSIMRRDLARLETLPL